MLDGRKSCHFKWWVATCGVNCLSWSPVPPLPCWKDAHESETDASTDASVLKDVSRVTQRKRRTAHHGQFDIDRDPTMKDFMISQSIDGGWKKENEARQIATIIRKYLYFAEDEANPSSYPSCRLNYLINVVLYIEKLQEDDIGPDGISSKLARIALAIDLITSNSDNPSEAMRGRVEATKSNTMHCSASSSPRADIMWRLYSMSQWNGCSFLYCNPPPPHKTVSSPLMPQAARAVQQWENHWGNGNGINKGSACAPLLPHLLRYLFFYATHFNFHIIAQHIPVTLIFQQTYHAETIFHFFFLLLRQNQSQIKSFLQQHHFHWHPYQLSPELAVIGGLSF